MRRAWRWFAGPSWEERLSLAGTLRRIGQVLVLLPLVISVLEWEPLPVVPLVSSLVAGALFLTLADARASVIQHAVEVYEAHPRPGETGTPFAIADCGCGWNIDADTLEEALAAAREHSNTGEPVLVRDPY